LAHEPAISKPISFVETIIFFGTILTALRESLSFDLADFTAVIST